MITLWTCEKCHRIGMAKHEEGDDIMAALYEIVDSHNRKSPSCDAGIWDIHIDLEREK